MIVRSKVPLRLGLCGGGTDLSPYCDRYGGYILNATINMFVHCTIENSDNGQVKFCAADGDEVFQSKAIKKFRYDNTLDLHKGVYNRVVSDFNNGKPISVSVITYSDAPSGSGLGASSTLVVAMIKAYTELLNIPLGEYDIAHLAYEIERVDIGWSGGKQDQYAATFGGFNFMEFYENDRVIVNPLRLKHWIINELESWMVLYYTGTSRDSAKIIDKQTENTKGDNNKVIESMHMIKDVAQEMKKALIQGDMQTFAKLLGSSWEAKKQTADLISNKYIESVYECALATGAISGKISGAGGGGFMFFMVDPIKKYELMKALEKCGGRIFNFQFVQDGMKGWFV